MYKNYRRGRLGGPGGGPKIVHKEITPKVLI